MNINKSFVIIALALILVLIKGSNGDSRMLLGEGINDIKPNYKLRSNEAECAKRRCCSIRDGLNEADLPSGVNCAELADYQCGQYDRYCEWNCNEMNPNKKSMKRTFRGISSFDGSYKEPEPERDDADISDPADDDKQLLQNCLSNGGKFLSVDDCGVEYEEEIKDYDVICHQLYNGEDHQNDHKDNTGKNDQHRRLQAPDNIGIFGRDGRNEVNNMDIFPYDAVLFMEFNDRIIDNGARITWNDCTATMISENFAITAAHCVWGNGNFLANDIKFLWSINDCNERQQQINNKKYYTWKQAIVWKPYLTNSVAANDFALVEFYPGTRSHGWMNFGYNNAFKSGQQFTMIGYPKDATGDACTPMVQTCAYNQFLTNEQRTVECDQAHGASGSAVFTYSNGVGTIYGIHSSSMWSRNTATGVYTQLYNVDARITKERYEWICKYTKNC